jgi:hypothetical protein
LRRELAASGEIGSKQWAEAEHGSAS